MQINSLESLSSTDVECYWSNKKSNTKEKYAPIRIRSYPCLENTTKRRKTVRDLTEEELRCVLISGLTVASESGLNKHRLGRPKSLQGASVASSSKNGDAVTSQNVREIEPFEVTFLNHCESSQFIFDLSVTVKIENFDLRDCCLKKWESIKNCDKIEALRSSQGSHEWHIFRRFRLTGSNCYSIYTYSLEKDEESWKKKSKSCFYPKKFSNMYTRHGQSEEKNALNVYKDSTDDIVIDNIGVVISERFPWLGFSPDGIVCDQNGTPSKLLEIKCPFNGKDENSDTFATKCKFLKTSPDGILLREKHSYFGQVQLGMALLNLKVCDLILYSSYSQTFSKLEIPFNPTFATKLISVISTKYFTKMLHFLCEANDE